MAVEATGVTRTPQKHISDELAENYDALVADPNRTLTYEQIAEQAAATNDAALAAWARERADSITEPQEPEVVPPSVDYDPLKLDDLKAIADHRGIAVDALTTKQDFIDALVEHDEAQPAAQTGEAQSESTPEQTPTTEPEPEPEDETKATPKAAKKGA